MAPLTWADASSNSATDDIFVRRLIDMIDRLVDDMNSDVGLTEPELDWVKHDIKMWLEWKLCSETTKDKLVSQSPHNVDGA